MACPNNWPDRWAFRHQTSLILDLILRFHRDSINRVWYNLYECSQNNTDTQTCIIALLLGIFQSTMSVNGNIHHTFMWVYYINVSIYHRIWNYRSDSKFRMQKISLLFSVQCICIQYSNIISLNVFEWHHPVSYDLGCYDHHEIYILPSSTWTTGIVLFSYSNKRLSILLFSYSNNWFLFSYSNI